MDLLANQAVLAEALRAEVGHFMFVSVLHGPRLRDEGNRGAACREQVVDELVASGLPWTVLRPTGFFNDMGDFFKMATGGTGWLIGDGSAQMNPIHGADLAAEAVRCLEDPTERGMGWLNQRAQPSSRVWIWVYTSTGSVSGHCDVTAGGLQCPEPERTVFFNDAM